MSLKRKISHTPGTYASEVHKHSKTDENQNPLDNVKALSVTPVTDNERLSDKHYDAPDDSNNNTELIEDDGTIKAGYIKSIKLVNFMCHEHFYIQLTPNLNFIIGNNGTGKSAILTAIAVGLGATASQAQRSGQLKGLIRHGTDKASVTIVINNTGDFAYQHDIYGDEITIERSITQTMSKFRVKIDNRFQDLKSTHLRAMLNFFGVRINNPMVFLNQDMAKKFLTSASKKDKYDNFASANYFDFVYSNYSDIEKNLKSVELLLQNVKPDLDKLQVEAEKAKQLLTQIRDSKEKIALVSNLNKLLAYKKLNELQATLKELSKRITEKTEFIQQCENIKNGDYATVVANFNQNIKELDENLKVLSQDIGAINDKIRKTAASKSKFQQEIKVLESDRDLYNRQLMTQERQRAKVSQDYETALAEFNAASNQTNTILTTQKETKLEELNQINSDIARIFDLKSQTEDSLATLEDDRKSKLSPLSRNIKEKQGLLNELSTRTKDVLSSFGPNMAKCVYEIQQLSKANKFFSPPIGPLGTLITIKEEYEADWAVLVQNRLLSQLNSFVVANQSDRILLEKVLKKYNLDGRFNYIIRKMSSFDYSKDIPRGNGLLRMMDILEFNSEAVKCTFVDLSGVHTILLAADYDDAQNLSRSYPYNTVLAVTKPHGYLLTTSNGGRDTTTLRRFSRHITMNNQNKYLGTLEKELEHDKLEFRTQNEEFNAMKEQLAGKKAQLSKEEYQLKQRKRTVGAEIDNIQSQLDSFQDSNKVDSLKSEVLRMEETLSVSRSSLDNISGEIQKQQEEMAPLDEDIAKLKAALADLTKYYEEDQKNKGHIIGQLSNYESQVRKAEMQAVTATNEVSALHGQLRSLKDEYKSGKEDLKAYVNVLRDIMAKYGDLSTAQVSHKIASLERDINENTVFSVQDLAGLEFSAIDAITKFKRERMNHKSFKNLLDKMETMLHQKKKTYLNHQTDCFNETNKMFMKYMKYRGFVGNLVFQNPHALKYSDSRKNSSMGSKPSEGELSIYARSKEESESRDVDTLSGGEKSFAQMSLLLSTWCVISSRIIALDEFDVFMDNINRTIGTKLIIQSLKDRIQTQTIIITPQDITAIADKYINDPHIKIHKMNAILRD